MNRGVPSEKVHAIFNWTDEQVFKPMDPKAHDGRVVMYAGTLGLAQGLDTLLTALRYVRTPDVTLALVGTGPAEGHLRRRVEDEGLQNVEFVGRLMPDEAREEMRRADVHLVSLADRALFRITMPSKVQSLLASGVPIIVSAPGEARQLVESCGAGVGVPAEDPVALAHAIDSLLARSQDDLGLMGELGERFYRDNCSSAVGSAALAGVLVNAARA